MQTYLRERVKEVLTGKSESIVVRIFGPELEALREQAERVEEALTGIEGLSSSRMRNLKDIPQVQVTVDLAKAGAVGLALATCAATPPSSSPATRSPTSTRGTRCTT